MEVVPELGIGVSSPDAAFLAVVEEVIVAWVQPLVRGSRRREKEMLASSGVVAAPLLISLTELKYSIVAHMLLTSASDFAANVRVVACSSWETASGAEIDTCNWNSCSAVFFLDTGAAWTKNRREVVSSMT